MSLYGPGVFIAAGAPCWWNTADVLTSTWEFHPNGTFAYHDVPGPVYATIAATTAYACSATPRYWEGVCNGGNSIRTQVGLIRSDISAAAFSSLGNSATSFAMTGGGDIYAQTVLVESATGTIAGDVIGCAIYKDSTDNDKAQWYVNGVPNGSPVTLLPKGSMWKPGFTSAASGHSISAHFDREDMTHMPAGAQAWACVMRISDAGGYSPTFSSFVAAGSGITYDNHKVSSTTGTRLARMGKSNKGSTLRVFGFRIDAMPGVGQNIGFGLALDSVALNATLGGVGSAAFYWSSGTSATKRWNNGTATALAGTGPWVAGDLFHLVWNPATGDIWFIKNGVPVQGNPLVQTGASLNVGANQILYPVVQPGALGVVRVSTAFHEIPSMPTYASDWDDLKLLPDQHYRGLLASTTEIETSLHFPTPWGGSRNGGATLGAIEVLNHDGRYDNAGLSDIRDQPLVIYEYVDDVMLPFANMLCDSVTFSGESMLSVLSRDKTALLDKRIDRDIYSIGLIRQAPTHANPAVSGGYDVSNSKFLQGLSVRDKGSSVTSWTRGDFNVLFGFQRTVNIAGKQTADFSTARINYEVALVNNDFTTWAGDNPSNFTVTELNVANNKITQVPAGNAQFIRGVGTAEIRIEQSISPTLTSGLFVGIEVDVTAYTSGDLELQMYNNTVASVVYTLPVKINGTGKFIAVGAPWGGPYGGDRIRLRATDGSNITVDAFRVFSLQLTSLPDASTLTGGYLLSVLVDEAGLPQTSFDASGIGTHTSTGFLSNQRPLLRAVLENAMDGWLMDCYTNENGVLTFCDLRNPDDYSSTWTLEERNAIGELDVEDDLAPMLSDSGMTKYNHSVYTEAELDASLLVLPAATVPDRTLQYQGNKLTLGVGATDAKAFHSFYKHALGASPFKRFNGSTNLTGTSTLAGKNDHEMYTLHRCYEKRKRFFKREYDAKTMRSISLGTIGTLNHSRHNANGKKVMIVAKTRRLFSPKTFAKFWG